MLIFFIHGVTVRNASYAKELQEAIAQRVRQARFKQGFWGDILNPLEETKIHEKSSNGSILFMRPMLSLILSKQV